MQLVGTLPETVIIGIEPGDMAFGGGLSPQLQEKLPEIMDMVIKELIL